MEGRGIVRLIPIYDLMTLLAVLYRGFFGM